MGAPGKSDPAKTEKLGQNGGQASTQKLSDNPGVVPGGRTEKMAASRAKPGSRAAAGGAVAGKTAERVLDGKPAEGGTEKADEVSGRRARAIKLAVLVLSLVSIIGIYMYNQRQEANAPSGTQPSPGAVETDRAAPPGQPVEKANLEATVLKVNRNFTHPDPAIKPAAGQRFVVVEFRLTNKDTRAVRISAPRQFKLRDSTQKRYEPSPAGAPDPKFPDGTVAPGQTVVGWIAFQIPVESKGLRLLFDPSVPV